MAGSIVHTFGEAASERLAHQALRRFPMAFPDHLGSVVFRVQDFAGSEMPQPVGRSTPWAVPGLYRG